MVALLVVLASLPVPRALAGRRGTLPAAVTAPPAPVAVVPVAVVPVVPVVVRAAAARAAASSAPLVAAAHGAAATSLAIAFII